MLALKSRGAVDQERQSFPQFLLILDNRYADYRVRRLGCRHECRRQSPQCKCTRGLPTYLNR